MPLDTYLIYLTAVAVFFATPPDTSQLLIISNSARFGLRKSLWTIAGDLSANSLQMTGAAFGLAAIIATSATAIVWIKWLGVAYLLWIGLQLLRSSEHASTASTGQSGQALAQSNSQTRGQHFRLFRQGFVTSMANPFAVIFFGALFPQFIDPVLPVLPQLLVLGVTYLVIDGAILLFWGWLGQRAARALKGASMGLINKICGALMILAAGLLAGKNLGPAE